MPDYNASSPEAYFKGIYESYKERLHDYLQAVTGSHDIAQDITQEIFLTLWKKKNDLHRIESIDKYIFRIARNESIDFFKKASLDAKLAHALKKRVCISSEETTAYLNHKEFVLKIEKAVDRLSPQRKKVYMLSRHEGLSIDQIARELNLTPNTAKNHLVEALKQLRGYLLEKDHQKLVLFFLALLGP